jgi:uncharacterized membrane protein
MSAIVQIRTLASRRPLLTVALLSALTMLLWAAARLIGPDRSWTPPPGADVALWLHVATVVPALPLGAAILWRRKGGRVHRILGRIWAGMMMIAAISSFWLQTLSGGLSFIHIFAVVTLISVPLAIWHIRRGNVQAHLNAMRGVYLGLVSAGLLAILPGRLLGTAIFG